MKFNLISNKIAEIDVDTIILSIFISNETTNGLVHDVDLALNGLISEILSRGDHKGKLREVTEIYTDGQIPADRIILVGLGPEKDFNENSIRHAAGAAALRARQLGSRKMASIIHGIEKSQISANYAVRAATEGTMLSLYSFGKYKSENKIDNIEEISFIKDEDIESKDLISGIEQGKIISNAVQLARDLVNEPPNICTPAFLAEQAMQIDDANTDVNILTESQIENLSMGAFLSVGRGSTRKPRFIVIEYNKKLLGQMQPLVLAGKAITFDTGGYSLKSASGMSTMKADMAGGAAVIGALQAASKLKVPYPVIGLIPATENMVSGTASHPSDIVTASNNKTIEIVNTDAEGRLILADALVYAAKYNPKHVIDLATLTGSAVIALGEGSAAALFAKDTNLADLLLTASESSGERIWRMPLYPEYTDWMKASNVADLRNSTAKRDTGIGTSAAFLQEFTEGFSWAHIDIAPMAFLSGSSVIKRLGPAGATGFGVRLLSHLMIEYAN
ncbi:MAG: leucyl aminopeptidase [Anaerolineaceae bacterium]|nr:leucyl aminopeptidase [Anaerolineaceae bacterium]